MSSEWMKVMLEEISRKKAESEQARAEEARREEAGQRAEEGLRAQEGLREQVRGDRPAAPPRSGVDRARE